MGKLLSADMVSQCGTGMNVGFGPREGKPVGDAGRCRTGVRKSPTPQEQVKGDTVTTSMISSPHCVALRCLPHE